MSGKLPPDKTNGTKTFFREHQLITVLLLICDSCHNFFQNQNNRKSTHTFALRILVFKLQQEALKFI